MNFWYTYQQNWMDKLKQENWLDKIKGKLKIVEDKIKIKKLSLKLIGKDKINHKKWIFLYHLLLLT